MLRKRHAGPAIPYSGKGASLPKKGTPYRRHIVIGIDVRIKGGKRREREIVLHATKGYRNNRVSGS